MVMVALRLGMLVFACAENSSTKESAYCAFANVLFLTGIVIQSASQLAFHDEFEVNLILFLVDATAEISSSAYPYESPKLGVNDT